MNALRTERRATLALAGGLSAAAGAIAAVVHLACAAPARGLLGFGFAGLAARPSTAESIFAHNTRMLSVVFAAILVARTPWATSHDGARGMAATLVLSALDTLLALQVAFNTALIGAALGAYGTRMVGAVLPHGPVELAAYSLALALYLRARRTPVALRHVATTAVVCLGALALAALLETYAAP